MVASLVTDAYIHYTMDNVSGSTLVDEMGNVDGSIFSSTFETGYWGNAYRSDSTGDYVQMVLPAMSQWSVACWVYMVSDAAYSHILTKYADQASFACKIGNAAYNRQPYCFSTATSSFGPSTPGVPLNAWTHVAYVCDGTATRFYINGALVATVAQAIPLGAGTYAFGNAFSAEFMNGRMDDYYIFQRAISSEEVNALAYRTYTNKTDLYAANDLLRLSGSQLTDESPVGRAVTIAGNVALSTAENHFNSSSFYFPGVTNNDYISVADSADWVHNDYYTIEFHVKLNSYGTGGTVIFYQQNGMELWVDVNGAWRFNRNGSTSLGVSANGIYTLGRWQHIALSWDGYRYRLFADGVEILTLVTSAIGDSAGEVRIGGYYTNYIINGYIQGYRITKGTCRYMADFRVDSLFPTLKGNSPTDYHARYLLADTTDEGGNYPATFSGTTAHYISPTGYNCIDLDGSSGNAKLPFNDGSTINQIAISFWCFKFNDLTEANSIFATDDDTNQNAAGNRLNFHFPWSNNTWYWDFGDISTGGRLTGTWNSAWLNTWIHVVVQYTANHEMQLYVNGELIDSAVAGTPQTLTLSQPLNVGYYPSSPFSYWWGQVADFRIYKRGLTQGEIRDLAYYPLGNVITTPPNNTGVDFNFINDTQSVGRQTKADFSFYTEGFYILQSPTQVNATWAGFTEYTYSNPTSFDIQLNEFYQTQTIVINPYAIAGVGEPGWRITAFRLVNGVPLFSVPYNTVVGSDNQFRLEVPANSQYIVFCIDGPADFYNVYDWITPYEDIPA